MTRIQLEAGDDLVQRLAHEKNPVPAIAELIWNSLDADAHNVSITLRRNDADGIVGVEVTDDGHGIPPESIESSFKWVGNSWKGHALHSQGEQRPLHGRSGQGRLRAFALGTEVTWETVGQSTDGTRYRTTVRGNARARNDFDATVATPTEDPPGTRFEASGRDGLDRLDTDNARLSLAAALAPYLITYDTVSITYDGTRFHPSDNILQDDTLDVTWQHEATQHSARLRIIEWRQASGRTIHLCDENGVPFDQLDQAPAADFTYSAYVMWEDMPQHHNEWMLANLEGDPSVVTALISAVNERIEDHFEERRAERRRELVAQWKEDRTYPYDGEAKTPEEKVERAAFDVVATSIRRHIPAKNKRQQKLTLGLLRQSLRQRPGDVSTLLDQFIGLPADERDQLDRLLKRTGLARLIQASTSVTNRLEFLRALELMVYDPDTNQMVGEREHLHRILENELWVFGEQYNLMVSERGLTACLDRHLDVLGKGRSDKTTVRRLDGTSGRLDLMLSVAATEHDRNRHLVVELKAPKVTATLTELAQIKSYAMAVAQDARFKSSTTHWDFWLVTSDMDAAVRQEINQRNRVRGLAFEPDLPDAPGAKVQVWVRDWGQIIEDAKRRLDYFQQSLQHDPSLDDAREYLNRHHGDVIPEGLLQQEEKAAANDAAAK